MYYMLHKSAHHLSQELYHRIYWYAKRNVDPRVIAHTLKIPLKTVEHLIERLSSPDSPKKVSKGESVEAPSRPLPSSIAAPTRDFLDIFAFAKTRWTVIDISGMVTKANIEKLHMELEKLLGSDWKTVALRMADVKDIDKDGFAALKTFHESFVAMRRYAAILDPSPEVDRFLAARDPDFTIPVFGTEIAFEERAFR